jgi:hypothetical protein
VKISLVEYHNCGLVFRNPRSSSGKLSGFYSSNTYSGHAANGSASAGAMADYLLERITKYLSPDAPRTLLEYGAGG